MRILMLTCHPNIRGPFPKILPLLAAALRTQGCTVVEEPWGRHRENESFFDKVIGRIGDIIRVRRRLTQEKFDLLLVQTTTEWRNYSRDIPMLWLARRVVSHVVVQFHGSVPEIVLGPGYGAFKKATRVLFQLADGVLVSSSEEQRAWQKFHPQARVFTTSNPFSPVLSAPRSNQSEPGWKFPENVPILLYVGRLIVEKGIFDLLEALERLNGKIPFHLLMVGSGPAEQDFRSRVQRSGLQDAITVTGHVDDETLRLAYRSADVFVLPSWSEGFPTVLAEAMDAGLPIVTTRIRGAADHLQDGLHAYLVPPRDPVRLAEALAKIMTDANLRSRMGKANQEKVKEFAPETVAGHYLSVLRRIAGLNPEAVDAVPPTRMPETRLT
jgi:glycosyltransferase involved in cell wall biosynthesis